MMRTRLLWFSLGFASTSAVMTHFVFKDLWIDRKCISSQLNEKFNSIDTRVSNLESLLPHKHTPQQISEESASLYKSHTESPYLRHGIQILYLSMRSGTRQSTTLRDPDAS